MNRLEKIKYLLSKKETRLSLCEKDLFIFWLYYFTDFFKSPSADFHKQWDKDLMTDNHVLLIWFRESAKTIKAIIKFIHNIAYKKKRFQLYYTYTQDWSCAKLFDIITQLQTNQKLTNDFWELFPWLTKEDEKNKKTQKSITEFITTNNIKCKAMSIWKSPRWQIFLWDDWAYRPDFIILDDIDTDFSVASIQTVDKTYRWLKWEFLGSLSDNCQIVFLWNIIKNDWTVIRFEKDYWNSNKWIIRRKAIIENWLITWPQRFTAEMIEEKRAMLWEISFNQNMLLIPYSWENSIISQTNIRYMDKDINEFDFIQIWVDPAISEKSYSDDFWITVTWFTKIWNKYNRHVFECYGLKWKDKNPNNSINMIYQLYNQYKVKIVNIETISFQKMLWTMLKEYWVATREITPNKDKVSRLLEYQSDFENWLITFQSDWKWIKELTNQLVDFPNVIHDDLVDSMVYSFYYKNSWVFLWTV